MKNNLFKKKILAFLHLIRAGNLLIVVLTQYMVRFFLIGPKTEWQTQLLDKNQFLLVLATVCVASAGYIINDYFDVKIDLVNKPNHVVIGRYIKRRWAMAIHQFLNLVGLLIGLYLSFKVFLMIIFAITALWFYSERFKREAFIGNFLVAFLTAFSLIIVAVYYQQNVFLVYTYSLFAFSISLIREIIKDIEDIRGDARYGCQTLPIIWGIRRTKILLYGIIVAFLLVLSYMIYSLKNQLLMSFFSLTIMPFLLFIYKLYLADKRKDFSMLSRICKIIMLIGICSMFLI